VVLHFGQFFLKLILTRSFVPLHAFVGDCKFQSLKSKSILGINGSKTQYITYYFYTFILTPFSVLSVNFGRKLINLLQVQVVRGDDVVDPWHPHLVLRLSDGRQVCWKPGDLLQ
jgi:hypothetical protein